VKNPLHDQIQSQLGSVDSKLAGLSAGENETGKKMEYYRERAVNLSSMAQKYGKLAGDLLQNRTKLRDLQERKAGADITLSLEVDNENGMKFEKPDPTGLPLTPIKPNRRVLLLLGLLLGGAAAAVMLFFVEYADRAIRGIADVKRHLGLPVLGSVPHFYRKDRTVRVTRAFNLRGALNCGVTAALVAALVISFFFDNEVSNFVNAKLNRETPVSSFKNYHVIPSLLANWNDWDTAPDNPGPYGPASRAALTGPEIEIEPGVFAAEENPPHEK
jgi:hypothetical protein